MGLSIYYDGKLKSPASLPFLIEEVKDVAEVHNWKYTIFKDTFPNKTFTAKFSNDVFGITFSPPKSEPVCLCFTSHGHLISPWLFEFDLNNGLEKEDISLGVFTKTQYAGVGAHKIIIDLFRYLSEKYFKEFKMIDESGYWETGDVKIMKSTFKRYNDLMDDFGLALETISKKRGESVENYLLRVMEEIHKKDNTN